MKRIIDGVTYNTATATKIAASEFNERGVGGPVGQDVLYQTRGGAFFIATHEVVTYRDRDGEWQSKEQNEVTPMSRNFAQAWALKGDVELFSDFFGEPPEASAKPQEPGATIYTRVPLSLKDRIETHARADGLSVNSYVIRCLESCATAQR